MQFLLASFLLQSSRRPYNVVKPQFVASATILLISVTISHLLVNLLPPSSLLTFHSVHCHLTNS